jgi:hypothetical protein
MPPDTPKIDCLKCKYFYITWDKNSPRGCRFFNFKSKMMPSTVVLQSSGAACLKFEPKV